jgi:hypothetical protein
MTCLEFLLADLDTQIDSEIDCVGCENTDCPYDKRVNEEMVGEG